MDKDCTVIRPTLPLEQQKAQNATMEGENIFSLPEQNLFHYTSREVFWKILEDESFLARHILFSNDYEEYELGRSKVERILKKNGFVDDIENAEENERYMICFCEQGDLLSQWRGYARHGVAMEFDFSLGMCGWRDGKDNTFSPYHCFTLTNNDIAVSNNANDKFTKRYISADEENEAKWVLLYITAPFKVFYTGRGTRISEKLKRAVNELLTGDAPVSMLVRLIPYIKNKKFEEEREYRIIFDLADLLKTEEEWIRSEKIIYLDVDGIKKPNIKVEFGNALDRMEKCIKIYYRNDSYTDKLNQFVKKLKSLKSNQVETELCYVSDNVLKETEILVGNGYKQEFVMRRLTNLIQTEKHTFAGVKVWCDGHLPIRRIIVGPSKDSELMKKSIVQYKNNKYWMKFVDVEISEIPFRD